MAEKNVSLPFGRRALVLALLGLSISVLYLSYIGIEKNLVYYLNAQELLDKGPKGVGATVRLGGLVQRGSVLWQPDTLALTFRVGNTESGPPDILVRAKGAPPQMFQEGIGAVVEGVFDGEQFLAERVMVKHSNEYRPPVPGQAPGDLYGTLKAPLDADRNAAPAGPGGLGPQTTRFE